MSKNNKMRQETQKGLSSLLGNIQKEQSVTVVQDRIKEHTKFSEINIKDITVNPKNPRTVFNEQALDELSQSIKAHGLIQPIAVTLVKDGTYQIVAGERRWKASKKAGLKKIPAYIRASDDQQIVEWAIVENLQRENLNPIELALGLQRMIDELNYTQEKIAQKISKDRSTVSNIIRLLKLPPKIQLALKENKISSGHARAIITLQHIEAQIDILNRIEKKGLSVRQTEELIRKYNSKKNADSSSIKIAKEDIHIQKLEEELSSFFQTKVTIAFSSQSQKGKLQIPFQSTKDLNRVLDKITCS